MARMELKCTFPKKKDNHEADSAHIVTAVSY